MKYYYRLRQPFTMVDGTLASYFERVEIKYRLGADFEKSNNHTLYSTYVALLDEEDLLAIELANTEVKIMDCVGLYRFNNYIRKLLSRFIK